MLPLSASTPEVFNIDYFSLALGTHKFSSAYSVRLQKTSAFGTSLRLVRSAITSNRAWR